MPIYFEPGRLKIERGSFPKMNKRYKFCLKIAKKRGDFIFFPLPLTNQYQQTENLYIKEKPAKIISEKKYKNRVAVFRLDDVKDQISISFLSSLSLVNNSIPFISTLKDYVDIQYSCYSYLKPDSFVNGKDPKIIELAKNQIKKENHLEKILKKLYLFTLDYLTYGKPIEGLYSYKQAMEERTTDCGGFSTFLASLLQSSGIPSRLVVGYLIQENLLTKIFGSNILDLSFDMLLMHAWLEVLLPNQIWFPLDPSIEWKRNSGLTKREGGFGQIPADRLVLSYGQDFTFDIDKKKYNVDLLQHPIYL